MSTTTMDDGVRARLGNARGPLLIGLVVVAVALLVALLTPRGEGQGRLDPGSAKPDGARALAEVLRQQGVDVRQVSDSRSAAAAAPGATVLINRLPVMARDQLERVAAAGSARLVLIAPEQDQLDVLAPGVRLETVTDPEVDSPGCQDPDAVAAGAAAGGGALYRVDSSAGSSSEQPGRSETAVCYLDGDGRAGSYLHTRTASGREVVVLGRPGMLANESITEDGNAALALRTLGSTSELVWYTADPLEPAASQRSQSLTELLPGWLPWVVGQLALAVLAVMVWRGRRLGPLVTEPLPVVVRAAETQEGRARLYRQARARDRAGTALRAASARRLSQRLARGTGGTARELVGEVASATGRREEEVRGLLLGPEPDSDLALVRLADDLDRLESEVSRPRATGPGRTTGT